MIRKLLNYTITVFVLSVIFSSCIKDEAKPLGTAGTPRVRLGETPDNVLYFSPFTNTKIVDLITVRRDEVREGDANQTVTVKVTNIADSVANQGLESLPDSLFTLVTGKGVTRSGNDYTITFEPGVTAVPITISLNGAKWDVAHKYGLYFKVADGGGKEVNSLSNESLVVLSIKNAYDGVYTIVSGAVTRYTAPGVPAGDALSGNVAGNPDVVLATAGPYSLSIPPAGSPGGLYWAVGNNSMVAGIDGLKVAVDPVTNLVTVTSSGNASLSNWAGHDNSYDPATKTFHLAFIWNPTSTTRTYEVVLKYSGPR